MNSIKAYGRQQQKFMFLFIGMLLSCALYSQREKDSIEIIKLLEKEGLTWRLGDKEGHAECWQATPNAINVMSQANGNFIEIPVSMSIDPPENIIGNGGFAFHSNHKIRIDGNSAMVGHNEVSVDVNGKENLSYEVRFLEKFNDKWKMVGQSNHFYPHPQDNVIDTTSYIQTVDIETGRIETILSIDKHFEAPNWHPDGYLIVNSKGLLYTLDLQTKDLKQLDTGFADKNNNDHGISPDNKWLATSHNFVNDPATEPYNSTIFVLPVEGGTPRQVTTAGMSFWHGWSPNGKRLAYCAVRDDNFDVYSISVNGGKEKRLTSTKGLDDGPDYSPDGKYIYFNSYRTGHMQIWRMLANGKKPEQMTDDENSNWFPHPSPDGKWIVYIAYTSDQKENHLFGKQVKLRLMDVATKEIRDITPVFFGGQGTINVPSWSPDSKKLAFVSYSVN